MTARRFSLALLGTGGLVAACAAPAGAATVVTPPCAVDVGAYRTVFIRGAGFTPGGSVQLSYTSPAFARPQFAASTQADGAGNFLVSAFPAPFKSFRTQEQDFGLFAEDRSNPSLNALTRFRQVRYGVTVSPRRARPSRRVRYTVRGFVPGRNVYMHFRFAGKTRRTVKLGRPAAPCGKKSRRMRLLPTRVRYGTWTVYVDQRRRFSRGAPLQVRIRISVFRTFRSRGARAAATAPLR